MKRLVAACVILLLTGFAAGCARRITIEKPGDAKIVIDDRVVNLFDSQSLNDVVSKLPVEAQKDVIREWIAARERLAQAAIQREKERGQGWLEALKVLLNWAAAAGIAELVK